MNNKILVVAIGVVFLLGALLILNRMSLSPTSETNMTQTSEEREDISKESYPSDYELLVTPIEHASLVLSWEGSHIYVDPVGEQDAYDALPAPDLIFITDIHGDHLSTSTLVALATNTTQLIVPQAVADMLPQALLEKSFVIANGERTTQRGFSIEAIPMYNVPESEDAYHTKGRGNGYVIERDGVRVYIAGDTGPTEEMAALENIAMAFVPMNLPYTMSVEDAARGVLSFAPRIVYPYHYRGPEGLSNVAQFAALVQQENPDIEVVLLEWYRGTVGE